MIRFCNKKGCSRRLSDQQHLEELGTFPICIFPSTFFMRLTFSFISSSISYLPEYWNPLRFQAGGRRRRPNLGLVGFDLMFAVFLVKDARVRYVVVDLVLVL